MSGSLLHHLLERSARRTPDAIAVADEERSLAYGELDRRANQLAHLLIDAGLRRGDRVGLYLDKSLESIVGIYAVLKAGGVYVPLDPHAPPTRVAYITDDCGMRFLHAGTEKEAAVRTVAQRAGTLEGVVILNGEADDLPPRVQVVGAKAAESFPATPPGEAIVNLDLAYVLYTSGSTGNPKGVMLSHLNALSFVDWAAECVEVRAADRLSSHAPLHFDLSIFDLFAAARAGASVCLVPRRCSAFPTELARFISDSRISVWYSVPSALTALTLRGGVVAGVFRDLRAVLFAGEVFPPKYLAQLMEILPTARFLNLYGPTETNVCTYHEVSRPFSGGPEGIPIGQPITGVDAFAVLEDGTLASAGELGELCVRGPTVMQGYWGDPERSAAALRGPLTADGLRTASYRTGDLVRRDEEGNFWFVGRRDAQVKSRGYRIELGEIEAALLAYPAVAECAALAVPDEMITNRIVAFIGAEKKLDEQELVRHCAASLPRYMIPEAFELMTMLPKTSTGKIDRRSLLDRGPSLLEPADAGSDR